MNFCSCERTLMHNGQGVMQCYCCSPDTGFCVQHEGLRGLVHVSSISSTVLSSLFFNSFSAGNTQIYTTSAA